MLKIAGAVIAGVLLLPTGARAQQTAELVIGWLDYSSGTISQELSVLNNGRLPIKTVRIECSFFLNARKLATGSAEITNIDPTFIQYKKILVSSPISPNSATCRVVSIKPERFVIEKGI
jgi:hypothetical protein